ncbi:GNAT family N-acetyltransferase [Riemerella columbina]|uniref:GNAT family N-acetyltransferase n=1 Tax=Riemerella columbina TaxID=103810 RepID=UPI00349FA294
MKGRGFGRMLVKEAIVFSREHGWQVHPHCSYAKRVMLKMPNIEDVFSPES